MKELLKNIICLMCVVVISSANAQSVKGIINYRGEINEKYVDSFLTALEAKKEVPMHVKQTVVSWYRDATPDDFVLNFKGGESYYYNVPALEEEGYNVGSKADLSPYYTKGDTIISGTSSLGNILEKPLDWKITQDTKKIGKYTCYKAVANERLYSRRGFYYNKKVVAWFVPEIPVNFGPSRYSGLPGLILQIERDMFTLTATKINFNPDENDLKIIQLDKKGKVITAEESHARIKEMMGARKKEYGN
ncbi:GLPGLI family protein [Zhouia amylolytica]|uniref:GLPGLI family protein n=1 Tax=Zhouia amylolytica TaxID=376730 RepID=UPI0020CC4841|nr:GLPGLI family protein [Zhouia amylolytica]MCQ0110352.1 GLPGLI family protein [Zhouia amylolytica]